jgi:hypothetical protein
VVLYHAHSRPPLTPIVFGFSTIRIFGGGPLMVAQWLRYCAPNRKVAGSIPDGVIEIFHCHNPSDRTMALGVDSASNRNDYQEHFLGVKAAGA